METNAPAWDNTSLLLVLLGRSSLLPDMVLLAGVSSKVDFDTPLKNHDAVGSFHLRICYLISFLDPLTDFHAQYDRSNLGYTDRQNRNQTDV